MSRKNTEMAWAKDIIQGTKPGQRKWGRTRV